MGIEPTSKAWEALVLPLNYARSQPADPQSIASLGPSIKVDLGVRIWSLHPSLLDAKGLVAAWREALLAQAVLRGKTRGYRNHPQLERFKASASPVGSVAGYLRGLRAEALRRGYRFDPARIAPARAKGRIPVTRGQMDFEWRHLLKKLAVRDPAWKARLDSAGVPRPHPLFRVVPGGVAGWERP